MKKSINDSMRDDIIRVVQEVQVARGRAVPAEIGSEARPIGDVPGFTIEDGAEATRRLEDVWSCPFGDNHRGILVFAAPAQRGRKVFCAVLERCGHCGTAHPSV